MNMLKYRRAHNKLQSHDGPPELTPIDTEIARHQGSSVALEATQERLQACKNFPTPDFPKIIEQRTEMDEKHSQTLQQLEKEKGSLQKDLDAARSNIQLDMNNHALMEQTETELQLLREEHTLLTQKLDTARKSLVAHFPDLNDNLDNLSSILAGNGEQRHRKKRKGTK